MAEKSIMNRREFFKQAGRVSATMALLPVVLPSTVFGKYPPSERISLGFIGSGKQSQHLIRSFLNEPGTQVVAVCDVDSLKLARGEKMIEDFYSKNSASGKYQGCLDTKEFQDIIQRDDIDAVVISTPDHWHGVNSIWALRSGKDVYCEKPLALTVAEGRAMVEETRRCGRVFQTGSMQRSDVSFRFACELVRNGYIGEIELAQVDVGGPPEDCLLPAEPLPDYLLWDSWIGPSQIRPYHSELSPHISNDVFPNWRRFKEFGGGGMTDWGAHHFDIVQWALGMDQSGPVEVIPPGYEGQNVLTYKYANGTLMTRDKNFYRDGGVLFHGTQGKIYVTRWFLKTWPENLMDVQLKPNETHLYDSPNHYSDWLNAIRFRTKPICDVEIGHRTSSVCNIGNIAYEIKEPLKWDPEKEKFVNSETGNRLLKRNLRGPWKL
jgi:predicted dehydrogenase